MGDERNLRPLEEGITRDLHERISYGGYLKLDTLLAAQQPLSDPPRHDEMLFIIQHQVAELWLKLIVHELYAAISHLQVDELGPMQKNLARIKQVQRQLFEQWAVLETLTPSEYLAFRPALGDSSGFQSLQYRLVEFMLGNKNAQMIAVFAHDPLAQTRLRAALDAPSLYDEFLLHLHRLGHPVPAQCVSRDWSQPHVFTPALVPVLAAIYRDPQAHWQAYHLCELLIDVETSFQLWRFRHMKTVERIIGFQRGTGGSSGVGFLKQALDLSFFPELIALRGELVRTPENDGQ